MKIEFQHGPGNPVACVTMDSSDSLTAQGGSMVAFDPGISITTSTRQRAGGGVGAGLKRMLSGESFFLNHFSSAGTGQRVWLSAALAGDLAEVAVRDMRIIVQGGSYLAAASSVSIEFGWQGFKSLFSGEGLFWLQASGHGPLILSSFGAIFSFEIDGEWIVDTGHIVAFEETLDFSISKAGKSWVSSFLGGEGLVCRFKGQGRIWCQSHSTASFGGILGPKLRSR